MNRFLTSMLAALKSQRTQTATPAPDPDAAGLPGRRIGMRVLAFAVFAALLGLAPTAQAQDEGRGNRNPNRGCDRDRGPDRGCPTPPGPPHAPPPGNDVNPPPRQ